MRCSSRRLRPLNQAAALLAIALGVTYSANANAATAPRRTSAMSLPAAAAATCSVACIAQQSLQSALNEPIRIGSSQFKLGLASSRLTVGWSVTF